MSDALREFPHSEVDRSSEDWANVAHLRHVFEGYRAVVLERGEASCPYSPGGARAVSWESGAKRAREDLAASCVEPVYRTELVYVYRANWEGKVYLEMRKDEGTVEAVRFEIPVGHFACTPLMEGDWLTLTLERPPNDVVVVEPGDAV